MIEIREIPNLSYDSDYKLINEMLITTRNIIRSERMIVEFGEALKIFGDTFKLISDKFVDRRDQLGCRTQEMARDLYEAINRIGISIIELSNRPNSVLDRKELDLNIWRFEWNIQEHWNRIVDLYAQTGP